MKVNVLVVYSSKHGGTQGIAERIGERLRNDGVAAAVRDVRDVNDLTGYDAVVLGSAVYMGSWRKDASDFAAHHRTELAARPVWLFSSGPLDEPALANPKPVLELVAQLGARGHQVFPGALHKAGLSLGEKLMVAAVARRSHNMTGDFRDWPQIDAWADGIAEALVKSPFQVRSRMAPTSGI
jgi:menaquinone-dependent protoporphyrinogen oxidase